MVRRSTSIIIDRRTTYQIINYLKTLTKMSTKTQARSYLGKHLTNRMWLGTLNNPDTALAKEYLELWHTKAGARYVNGQLEKGAEGTVHIQFFLNFKEPVRISKLKKHCQRAHFEPVKRDNGASTYCLKEDTRVPGEGPWEFGEKPMQRNDAKDWDEIKKHA